MNETIKINKRLYSYAIYLLARQDYSIAKLQSKMLQKEYIQSDIDLVINKLINIGYLNENNYIRAKVKQLSNKNYSEKIIKYKLLQEKISITEVEITELFFELGMTENNCQISNILSKKAKLVEQFKSEENYLEKNKIKQKLIRALATKGHNIYNIEDYI